MNYKLTPSQEKAANDIVKAFQEDDRQVAMIEAGAGYGKTFVCSIIAQRLGFKPNEIGYCSPTHSANEVLYESLIHKSDVITVYSMFGMKLTADSAKQEVVRSGEDKVFNYGLVLIDEISALGKLMYARFIEIARDNPRVKFILMGDRYQARPVNDVFSPFWGLDSRIPYCNLTDSVRMHEDSPLLKTSLELRELIDIDYKDAVTFDEERSEYGSLRVLPVREFNAEMKEYFTDSSFKHTDGLFTAYHNSRVVAGSNIIRSIIRGKDPDALYEGEHFYLLEGVTYEHQSIIHNNARIIIEEILAKEVYNPNVSGYEVPQVPCYKIRVKNVVTGEDRILYAPSETGQKVYKEAATLLKRSAIDSRSRFAWGSYYSFIKSFALLRSQFSTTLHKVQGMTVNERIYVDAVDLQYPKAGKKRPEDFLNLLNVGITRSRFDVVVAQR